MISIVLTDRNEEIFNKIKKKDVSLIINNILARSIMNGLFIKEASLILDSQTISNLIDEFNFVEKKETRQLEIKTKIEKLKPAKNDIFEGFN